MEIAPNTLFGTPKKQFKLASATFGHRTASEIADAYNFDANQLMTCCEKL